MQEIIDNAQKYDNYKILKVRLKKAISQKYWFEACMIEYAIIEDRTASILKNTDVVKDPYEKKLSNKLRSIEYQIGKEHPIISKKVDKQLLVDISAWKDARNEEVHRACIHFYDEDAMSKIAIDGNNLVNLITNTASRVKNACIKKGKGQ